MSAAITNSEQVLRKDLFLANPTLSVDRLELAYQWIVEGTVPEKKSVKSVVAK